MCHRLMFYLFVLSFVIALFYLPLTTWVMTWLEIPNGLPGPQIRSPRDTPING